MRCEFVLRHTLSIGMDLFSIVMPSFSTGGPLMPLIILLHSTRSFSKVTASSSTRLNKRRYSFHTWLNYSEIFPSDCSCNICAFLSSTVTEVFLIVAVSRDLRFAAIEVRALEVLYLIATDFRSHGSALGPFRMEGTDCRVGVSVAVLTALVYCSRSRHQNASVRS